MKRVKLVVSYDGTNYHGWQLQPNGLSIEAVLNEALSSLLREKIAVIGASRTDSGVHAMGNVAVFDTENRMPAEKICFALNQRLPGDIRIQSSREVPADWHPRKQNCVKTYEYRILNRKVEMPTSRLYTYFCYFPMDVEKMQKAAGYLLGEHDFKSFCTVRTQAEDTVRTVYSLTVERDPADIVTIRISGSGFLYNMVRIIAGTLLRVGTGLYPPEHVEEILDARNRQAAGPTLPAKGLTLIQLQYEEELKPEITSQNKYWEYLLVQREIRPKKKAYLVIRRCEDSLLPQLLTRIIHQAARNGARWIYVVDMEDWNQEGEKGTDKAEKAHQGNRKMPGSQKNGRLAEGQEYGYYQLKRSHCYLEMEKELEEERKTGASSKDQPAIYIQALKKTERLHWISLYNEAFFSVAGSMTYDFDLLEKEEADGCQFFWLCAGEAQAGVLILAPNQDKNVLAIDGIGIKKECRGKGYGIQSLWCIQEYAESKAYQKLSLLVADNNLRARHIYEQAGFQVTKKRPDFFCAESAGFDENPPKT